VIYAAFLSPSAFSSQADVANRIITRATLLPLESVNTGGTIGAMSAMMFDCADALKLLPQRRLAQAPASQCLVRVWHGGS
jgi:hypothetical protein